MSNKHVIDELELRLSMLAYEWRKIPDGNSESARTIVKEYHAIFKKLWKLGWDGEGLLPDSELPNRLMPEYYLERWNIK